ncbi:hypothetical protein ABH930_002181 [Kitasatospora sp. GAS204A]|uniref:eCIS core domain-containing protein n=1 Tax=unclassified Kitasatospora TaxID=2633591 RepID=UPI0024758D25|nr:DUF4157 domain-containing protein [Kitasatospora sp. GAS204B]MDH6115956.1 hypothetical protein [Kitasatospora sp. GAS204B]
MRDHANTRGTDKEEAAPAVRKAAQGGQLPGLQRLQSTVGNSAVVQMLRKAGHPGEPAAVQRAEVQDVLRTNGRPLDDSTRAEMESRLDADFSDVRIHDDSAARASAAAIGARAYTAGQHVVIGEGGADKHTLAHELTHVIQQRQGPVAGTDNGAGLRVSDPADRFEREAESTARRVLTGPVPTTRQAENEARAAEQAPGQAVQRWANQNSQAQQAMTVSAGGLFAVAAHTPTSIWVHVGAPAASISPALRPTRAQPQDFFGTGNYREYQLAREIFDDCLHTAEEIMHNAVGELKDGALNSNIRTTGGTLPFGTSDELNRERADAFDGEPDRRAAPVVGQAYVMVAMNPGETVMSQYHAAAVVGVDGDDTVTMEAFAGSGQTAPEPGTYTVGSTSSFHDYWTGGYYSPHYPQVTMKTVVIGRRGRGPRVAAGGERPANPNVA